MRVFNYLRICHLKKIIFLFAIFFMINMCLVPVWAANDEIVTIPLQQNTNYNYIESVTFTGTYYCEIWQRDGSNNGDWYINGYGGQASFNGNVYGVRKSDGNSELVQNYSFTYNLSSSNNPSSFNYTLPLTADLKTKYSNFYITCTASASNTITYEDQKKSSYNGYPVRRSQDASISYAITGKKYTHVRITNNLSDVTSIENKNAIFQIQATFPSGIEDYQWQKATSQGETSLWTNIEDGALYSGTKSNALIIKNCTTDMTGDKYRCVLKSNTVGIADAVSKEGVLTVMKKNYKSIEAKTVTKTMDVGKNLNISEVLVLLKYDNDTSEFADGFSNLCFKNSDGELVSEKVIALGENTFTVLLQDETNPCETELNIMGADLSAPKFNCTVRWKDGAEYGQDISNDNNRSLIFSIDASDNVTEKSDIQYAVYKDQTLLIDYEKNSEIEITAASGNGTYTIYAKDNEGNISEGQDYSITAWDFEKPETVRVIQNPTEDQYSVYRTATVNASDTIGYPEKPYFWMKKTDSFDYDKADWSSSPDFITVENGTYTVYVRDKAGNYASQDVVISKIDHDAPEIDSVDILLDADKNVLISVNASDDTDMAYCINGGTWQTEASFQIAEDGIYKIQVKDAAGNISKATTQYIDIAVIKGESPVLSSNGITSFSTISPASWTSGAVTISLKLPEETKKILADEPYSWNSETAWKTTDHTQAIMNGKYKVYIKDRYGNQYESGDIAVNNIDRTNPTVSAKASNAAITITGADKESGLDRITVKGGDLSGETVIKVFTGNESSSSVSYTALANGTYTVAAYDGVGNKSTSDVTVSGIENKKQETESKGSSNQSTTNNYYTTEPKDTDTTKKTESDLGKITATVDATSHEDVLDAQPNYAGEEIGSASINSTKGEDRVFYTIRGQDGAIFYLVADDGSAQLMDAVTMSDLEQLDQEQESVEEEESDVGFFGTKEVTELDETDLEKEDETVEEKKSNGTAKSIMILLLAIVVGGAYYYFKVYRGQKNTYDIDEFDDEEEDAPLEFENAIPDATSHEEDCEE